MLAFNQLTGRPTKAYNIGHAYVRGLGSQDDHRLTVSVIVNYGGGVMSIPGLSYLRAGELLRTLKDKMADPEWIRQHQFDGSRWRPEPLVTHLPLDMLQRVIVRGVALQVFVSGDNSSLRINERTELASHPNPHSCHDLLRRILQESEERVTQQADYINQCGGSVDMALLKSLLARLYPVGELPVTGSFVSSLWRIQDEEIRRLQAAEDREICERLVSLADNEANKDSEQNTCTACDAPNDDGEGWDGLCGNCADKADPEE